MSRISKGISIYKYLRDDSQEEVLPTLILSTNLVHTRAPDYYEDWLPQYLGRDFFNLFRLSRDTFVNLLGAINCAERQFVGGQQPVSMEKCVLMFLWWLGKGDTLISVSDRFNVAISTVYSAVEFVIPKILELQMKYISWPNQQEALNIERAFRAKSGFPHIER
ncbi:hypothetical protein JTB14_009368 [Gonioctena quinquepunctata]|nr:hypothetical protein JTB14_009368 [Gonioctena quinquepunctata]